MKRSLFFLMTVISATGFAQEELSGVFSISTQVERIEIIRMRPGTDLLDGLNRIIAEKGIRNGVILTGIGSVTDYHFHVVSDKNLPPAEEFPKASVPMDLIAVQGFIFNKRVHAHITLADENSVIGGHLEPGTKALTFFLLTVGVLPDELELDRFDSYL
jgi:predicted DNA-binding protein with PD1-like motif